MEHFVIPEMYCPFPSTISPHLEQVQKAHQEWATHFQLYQTEAARRHYEQSDLALFACRCYPKADPEALSLCAGWLLWTFLYDDLIDQTKIGQGLEYLQAINQHMLAIISDPPLAAPQGPLAHAFVDVFQRTARLTSSIWRRRFFRHHVELCAAILPETHYRSTDQVPDLDTYYGIRRASSAIVPAFDLIELAGHYEIPDAYYQSPLFQVLLQTGANIIAWQNDILSYMKEQAHGDNNNLVAVLQHAHGCSLQHAMNQAEALIEKEIRHYQELLSNLQPYPVEIDQSIRAFLDDQGSWIGGYFEWMKQNIRFAEKEYSKRGTTFAHLEQIMPVVSS